MNKTVKKTIITLTVLTVLIVLIILLYTKFSNFTKTVYNDNILANGNISGNLYNGGYFAEADGRIYFSNPYDDNTLYVMNSDETTAKKISKDKAYSINVYGNYIYYSKNNIDTTNSDSIFRSTLLGAVRCNLDGTNAIKLNDRYTGTLSLVGNTIFFQNFVNDTKAGTTTYTIKSIGIDGKDVQLFSDKTINIAGTKGSIIYYTDPENNHNIYSISTKNKSTSRIVKGICWMPIVQGNQLYYINAEDNYSLVKTSLSNPDKSTVLVDERICTYNVSDTYIYFQIDDQENSKICRIRKDASTNEYEVIKEGNFENINLTSNYVYFNSFDNRNATYRTSVNGPIHLQLMSDVVEFEK